MKVYIINLDKDHERLKNVTNQLDIHNYEYERIPAIYGKHIDKKVVKDYTKYLNESQVGCYLSHMKTMQQIITDDVDRALILEDDVVLSDWFPKMEEIIDTLPPDFDMCWVGNSRAKWPRNTCSIIPIPAYDYDQLEKVNDYVYKVDETSIDNYPMGAYGLVVSKKGAKKALRTSIVNHFKNPIDVVYVKSGMNNYMTIPSIITHCYDFGSNLTIDANTKTNPFENVWKHNEKQEVACLEMLQLIENVLPINYSLAFGSLLGYTRHQKFIPYDDDIDIIIDREDLKTFEKTLPILKQHMNVYKYKKPIFNNTLYYKLYPKDDSVSIKIDGHPYRYPFIDVFVYDKVYIKNILYKEPNKKVLYIDNKIFEMNEDTELVDLGSHSVKGLTIKTRVFKDRTIFLDIMYPNWEEMCISSTWNHRLEKPTTYRGQFFCKNILF